MEEVTGWLLDVYPDPKYGALLWILDANDQQRRFFWLPFEILFYVRADEYRLEQFSRALVAKFTKQVALSMTTRLDLFDGEVEVLAVRTQDPIHLRKIFNWAYRHFPDMLYFDVDVPFALRFTARYRIMPLSQCNLQVEDHCVRQINAAADVDNSIPPLRLLSLEPNVDPEYVDPDQLIMHFGEKETHLDITGTASFATQLDMYIACYDPDIILTKWGDTWLFPWLLDYAKRHGVRFNPNRVSRYEVLRRKAFSYHTYGRVLHRGQQVHLVGRWHVDQTNAVMYGEYQLAGILEQARITGLPVQETARKSPGAGITSMQMITAMQRGVLVPYHKSQVESFKTPAQLISADRGGLVGQPIIGIHHYVAGIDFFSMYPQIMARYNISPETLQISGNGDTIPVPNSSMAINQHCTGLIGETLQILLERRKNMKQDLVGSNLFDNRCFDLDSRSNALKWLLVVCFGYLGHKHFRWMRIEAHEAVTALGREVLLQAKEVAERHGFTVLYFNVDGLYVQKQGSLAEEDFADLLREIRSQTGLQIGLDGVFRWIAFLPSRGEIRIPVANRYFGALKNGKLKVRGIEIRRHDTPPFIHKVQIRMLHILGAVPVGYPLQTALPGIFKELESAAADLRDARVPLEDLLVSQRLSRVLAEYRQPSPAAQAAAQLATIQKPMSAGQVVHFIYTRTPPGVLAWRVGLPFLYQSVDVEMYLKLLVRAVSNIVVHLGISELELARKIGLGGQISLFEWVEANQIGGAHLQFVGDDCLLLVGAT